MAAVPSVPGPVYGPDARMGQSRYGLIRLILLLIKKIRYMKFNISSKALAIQLAAVSKVVNSKNSLSILDNFLFRLSGNTLSIIGSDQENVMTATLEVYEPEGEGCIAVNSKRILDMLKEVSGQPLTFYINDDTKEIDIRFMNGHFNFMGINGTDTIRPIMTGICWDFCPLNEAGEPAPGITFVATDTHKLVRYINSGVNPGLTFNFILPPKPASILRNLIAKEQGG